MLAWLLAGLVTSFSQSSIAALLLGLAVLAAWRWDVRSTIYVALARWSRVAAVVVVAGAAEPAHRAEAARAARRTTRRAGARS